MNKTNKCIYRENSYESNFIINIFFHTNLGHHEINYKTLYSDYMNNKLQFLQKKFFVKYLNQSQNQL